MLEAFKHRVVRDPKYAEKTWKILYRNAYNMMLHKCGEKLYFGLVGTMTLHLREISKSIEAAQGDSFLEELNRERTGEVMDRGLMRNIVKVLLDLGSSVYQDKFEKPFLEVSAEFYKVESQKFIECCDCGDYLKKAEKCLLEAIERVNHYLDAKSKAKIIEYLNHV